MAALAAHAVLGALALDLAVREAYHRLWVEQVPLVTLFGVWVACLLLLVVRTGRWLPLPDPLPPRAAVVLAVAYAVGVLVPENSLPGWPIDLSRVPRWTFLFAVSAAVLALTGWRAASTWRRAHGALAVGAVLFALTPLATPTLLASPAAWPATADRGAGVAGTTVFLLLDEMNARAGATIVEVLERAGVAHAQRRTEAVGNRTAVVIPSLFSRQAFGPRTRPCTPTAVCNGTRTLDFARVRASRDDIDVVGFYVPYCAIGGLRSCARLTQPPPGLGALRWRCAWWRRGGAHEAGLAEACGRLQVEPWQSLLGASLQALWQAPTWRLGGLLYAHLPLPHPPGDTPGRSLAQDYGHNVERAAGVVGEVVERLRKAGRPWRLVVFSDHPLRRDLWCPTYSGALARACMDDATLTDAQVPLIVAGNTPLPSLARLSSNLEVFGLALPQPP